MRAKTEPLPETVHEQVARLAQQKSQDEAVRDDLRRIVHTLSNGIETLSRLRRQAAIAMRRAERRSRRAARLAEGGV